MEELEEETRSMWKTRSRKRNLQATSEEKASSREHIEDASKVRMTKVDRAAQQEQADYAGHDQADGSCVWPSGVVLERQPAACAYKFGEWAEHIGRESRGAGQHRLGNVEGYRLPAWSAAPEHAVFPALMDGDRALAVAIAREERARLRRHASQALSGGMLMAV